MDRNTPLALGARTLLRKRTDVLFERLEEALLTFEREAVHDLRVASRRLRAGLQLFSPCYPPKETARARREVRRLTRRIGELRNIDEGLAFFDRTAAEVEGPGREVANRIADDFRRRQQKEQECIRPLLESFREGETEKRLRRIVSRPFLLRSAGEGTDPFTPLAPFAREALADALVPVLDLSPLARREAESEAQHRLRIAVKNYRYRVELLAPLLGEVFAAVHPLLKEYQDELGSMHDLDVFGEEVAGHEGHSGAPVLLEHLGALRREHFRRFEELLSAAPFEELGRRIAGSL